MAEGSRVRGRRWWSGWCLVVQANFHLGRRVGVEAWMIAVEKVSLTALRRRRSAKWRTYPLDVLPLPVAEMDFPIAGPVAQALHAAIDRSDLGYASPSPGLAEALAG